MTGGLSQIDYLLLTNESVMSYYSQIGIRTPSRCSGVQGGVPTGNVPVVELTVTSTIFPVSLLTAGPFYSSTIFTSSFLAKTSPNQFNQPSSTVSSGGSTTLGAGYAGAKSTTQTPLITMSNSMSDIIDNSQTTVPEDLSTRISPPVVTIDGIGLTIASELRYTIGSQTLYPGRSAITMDGALRSLYPPATSVVAGDSTLSLSPDSPLPAFITIGGLTATPSPQSSLPIGTQTLLPGGPAITISGTYISLAPFTTEIMVGSSILIPSSTPLPEVITVAGFTITEKSASYFVLGTQTLVPGGHGLTFSGVPLSLATGDSALIVGTSTVLLQPAPTSFPGVITIAGTPIIENSASEFVIGTQTLIPGAPAVTVSGTKISLAPDRTDIVIGTHTENVATTLGIGGIIMSGFGVTSNALSPTSPVGSGETVFASSGERIGKMSDWVAAGAVLLVISLVC